MAISDDTFAGALFRQGRDDPKLLRALALDDYLHELEANLSEGKIAEARELIVRMRKFIALITKEKEAAA